MLREGFSGPHRRAASPSMHPTSMHAGGGSGLGRGAAIIDAAAGAHNRRRAASGAEVRGDRAQHCGGDG